MVSVLSKPHARIVKNPITIADPITEVTIIVSRFYVEAADRLRGAPFEWRWFPRKDVAQLWMDRCAERGVRLRVNWLYAS